MRRVPTIALKVLVAEMPVGTIIFVPSFARMPTMEEVAAIAPVILLRATTVPLTVEVAEIPVGRIPRLTLIAPETVEVAATAPVILRSALRPPETVEVAVIAETWAIGFQVPFISAPEREEVAEIAPVTRL